MGLPDLVFRQSRISLEKEGLDLIGPEQVYDFLMRQNGICGRAALQMSTTRRSPTVRIKSSGQLWAMASRNETAGLSHLGQGTGRLGTGFMIFSPESRVLQLGTRNRLSQFVSKFCAEWITDEQECRAERGSEIRMGWARDCRKWLARWSSSRRAHPNESLATSCKFLASFSYRWLSKAITPSCPGCLVLSGRVMRRGVFGVGPEKSQTRVGLA